MIWVFAFVGFISAGITNVYITDRFGFGIVGHLHHSAWHD